MDQKPIFMPYAAAEPSARTTADGDNARPQWERIANSLQTLINLTYLLSRQRSLEEPARAYVHLIQSELARLSWLPDLRSACGHPDFDAAALRRRS